MSQVSPTVPRLEGSYVVCDEIAAGGTATVHFGRLLGQGFARTVAIKRLHPTFARDPAFVDMFRDEARLAARIRHPNVCSILDVATVDDVPCLILEYVHGDPLSRHIDAAVCNNELIPYDIAAAIVCGMLQGLHAAHEATDDAGNPLQIIHRDVSPQNVLVGNDGIPRVVDFGMAKAMGRVQNTAEGQLKGKLGYMAPEQFAPGEIDRRVDIYSAAVVLWEALTAQFLFERTTPAELLHCILDGELRPPRSVVPDIPAELDAICMRGLSRDPAQRFATAHEMAVAIESAVVLPSPREIGAWVERVAGDVLRARATVLARIEAEHPSAPSLPHAPADPAAQTALPLRKRVVVVGLGLMLLAVLLLVLFGVRGQRAPETFAAEPPVPVASTVEPVETASAPAPSASEPAPTPSLSAAPAVTPRNPRRNANCSRPYTIDAEGIRRPKRECLFLNPASP